MGIELRNELRASSIHGETVTPTWGGGVTHPPSDWQAAAARGGNAVLAANPELLIVVDNVNYSTDFIAVKKHGPPALDVPRRLVWSAHDYSWSQHVSAGGLAAHLDTQWGFLLEANKSYTAPIWASEFGTSHNPPLPGKGSWWRAFLAYIEGNDLSWGTSTFCGTLFQIECTSYGHGVSFLLSASAMP